MMDRIRPWIPPRQRALAQGAIVGVLALFALTRVLTTPEPQPVQAQAASEPQFQTFSTEDREALAKIYPLPTGVARDRVQILADLIEGVETMGLRLISRRVEPLPKTGFPTRQRVRLEIEGVATGQAEFMRYMLEGDWPIVVAGFRWHEGEEPTTRRLEVTLDVLIRETSETSGG